jgi:hypothetical protein
MNEPLNRSLELTSRFVFFFPPGGATKTQVDLGLVSVEEISALDNTTVLQAVNLQTGKFALPEGTLIQTPNVVSFLAACSCCTSWVDDRIEEWVSSRRPEQRVHLHQRSRRCDQRSQQCDSPILFQHL